MEAQGYPKLQGHHYEEVVQRTPVPLSKYCDISMKKTSCGFGWARRDLNTQRRTWSKLTFLYSSILLLRNPSTASASSFRSSTFTYIQYYIIEENGKTQANPTLLYTLYICIPALLTWVLVKKKKRDSHKGLMKILSELIITISNRQFCDLLICLLSIRIVNQRELLCISVILIWGNSIKRSPVVTSPSPHMWEFFKWTCMLMILDQSKYGRIFIHEKIILQIFSIIVLSV